VSTLLCWLCGILAIQPYNTLLGHASFSAAVALTGIYAATAGDDCQVVVWLVERQIQVGLAT